MKQMSFLGIILLVNLYLFGCSGDSSDCTPSVVIQSYCGSAQNLDSCDCLDQPVTIVAFIDLVNLPSTILVSSTNNYGHGSDMIGLVCLGGGGEVPESGYDPEWPNVLDGYPIKAVVREANIRKVMEPGNGAVFPTWHIEIQSAEQVSYYHVINDSTDVLIVP